MTSDAALAARADAEVGSTGARALWPYLRPHRRTLGLVVVLSFLGAGAALALPLLVRAVLDGLGSGASVTGVVALLAVLMVAGALLDGVSRYLLQRTAEGVVLDARIGLGGRLLRLPVAEYDRRRTGDLISRVGADTTLVSAVVTSGLVELASGAVVAVGALVLMALLDPLLLVVTVLAVGLGIGAAAVVSTRVRARSRRAQAAVGDMTSSVERALSAVRTIRAARAEARETAVVASSARAAYDAGLGVARLEAAIGPLANVAVQASFLAVLGVGGARVATGTLSVGDLVAFVMLLFLLIQPTVSGLRAWTTLQSGLGALSRIEEILDIDPEDAADLAAAPTTHDDAPAVALVDVDFDYPDGTAVLRGVSFTMARGTRTALVGPSGAGKSTVMALVERFYDVSGGAVRVGGADVRAWPRGALRARLGYVEQEAPVLAGTVRENLLLAAPGADEAALRAALASVNLLERIDRGPHGLDSEVGDAGVLLSGGERQRLAIARALLAAPPVLLLDEPTASLDARNEAALRVAVDAVAHDRTLLVVAHRLSTVVDADQIVVLDGGRVVAVGRHEELVTTSPLYRELAETQLLV